MEVQSATTAQCELVLSLQSMSVPFTCLWYSSESKMTCSEPRHTQEGDKLASSWCDKHRCHANSPQPYSVWRCRERVGTEEERYCCFHSCRRLVSLGYTVQPCDELVNNQRYCSKHLDRKPQDRSSGPYGKRDLYCSWIYETGEFTGCGCVSIASESGLCPSHQCSARDEETGNICTQPISSYSRFCEGHSCIHDPDAIGRSCTNVAYGRDVCVEHGGTSYYTERKRILERKWVIEDMRRSAEDKRREEEMQELQALSKLDQ